jgi:hypothetical protein
MIRDTLIVRVQAGPAAPSYTVPRTGQITRLVAIAGGNDMGNTTQLQRQAAGVGAFSTIGTAAAEATGDVNDAPSLVLAGQTVNTGDVLRAMNTNGVSAVQLIVYIMPTD